MFPDFKELLSAFNDHRVKYLVVGGYAVSFHAQARATKDLDILVEPSVENSKAVFAALARFGAPLEGLSAKDFAEPENFFRMGAPPVMVDILPKINGVQFEEAWRRRVEVPVDSELTISFISRVDLIAAKLAAGRPQDLADVAALNEGHGTSEGQAREMDPLTYTDRSEQARKKGVADWLKLRARREAEGDNLSIEDRQAKARAEWLKLRGENKFEADTDPDTPADQTKGRKRDPTDDSGL